MTEQLVEIQLVGGLDEKTARKLVGPDAFLDLVNARFDRGGQIAQRYGTVSLTTNDQAGSPITSLRAGHGYRGYPVIVSNDRIYAYSKDAVAWIDHGRVPTPQVSRQPLLQLAAAYTSVDHAWYNNIHLIAVERSDIANHTIIITMIDDQTGVQLSQEVLSNTSIDARSPRIFICGTLAVCVYWVAGGEIRAHTLSLASFPLPSWSAFTTLHNNSAVTTSAIFDAKPVIGHANRFYLVYGMVPGPSRVRSAIWNSTNLAAPVATFDLTMGNLPEGIGVYARNGDSQFWVAWGDSTGGVNNVIKYVATNTSTAAEAFPPATVQSVTIATDGRFIRFAFCPSSTTQAVLWSSQGGEFATKPSVLAAGVNGPAAAVLSTARTYWLGLLTQPWVAPSPEASTRQYVGVQLFSTVQSTNYVAELDASNLSALSQIQIAARFATRLVGQSTGSRAEMTSLCVPSVPNPQTGRYYIAHNVVTSGSGTGQRVQLYRTTVEYEPSTRHRGAEYRASLRLGGGCPLVFDGQRAYEEGFHWYPEIVNVTKTGAVGGLFAGTYLVSACYVFTLASGEIVRSAPSPPFVFTAALNDKATYIVRTYTAGAMRGYTTPAITSVRIECYRTQVGGETSTLIDNATLTSANANDPTTNTISIDDTNSDANIASNLPLYTDGTPPPLENLCPPSLYPIVLHGGRLWGIDESRRRVYYTDEPIPGEAPRWHEVQSIDIDAGDDLVGFIPVEGTLFVAANSFIVRLVGQPSDRLGSGTLDFQAVAATTGMGAIAVAQADFGTIYQSPNGDLQLLDRSGAIQDVGLAVQTSTESQTLMTAAVEHGIQRELRFAIQASAAASTGEVLVFESDRKQWMKRQYQAGAIHSFPMRDMWMVGGVCYFGRSNGAVYYEDTTTWTDDGAFNEMTVGLPFVSMGAIQGYQRCRTVRLLGDRYTAHDVEITVYFDGSESSPVSPRTFSDATYGALDPYELEHGPARQKSSRFRVQFKTKAPSGGAAVGTGRAAAWQSVAFLIETMPGGRRTRPAVRG